VNAVGYVNTVLHHGFNLISNPLDNKTDGNTISKLFGSIPNIPDGLTVYKFVDGKFATPAAYDALDGSFGPAAAASQTVVPGEGVFVLNPGATDVTVTFVGDVPTGDLTTTIPKGFSITSSKVPQAGTVSTDLKYVGVQDDVIYKFASTTQKYGTPSTFDFGAWTPNEPSLDVGEAAFFFKAAAGTWTRTFNVNQ